MMTKISYKGYVSAVCAITIADYSWRKEDKIGSIAQGKIAKLTELERDPYAIPESAKRQG